MHFFLENVQMAVLVVREPRAAATGVVPSSHLRNERKEERHDE